MHCCKKNNNISYPIYCINLEYRKDRKKHSFEQFAKLGISKDNVIYLQFIKDNTGYGRGCFNSHMKVWNDFFVKYPTHDYCLVFEDDFVVSKNSKHILKKAVRFIEKNYKKIDILNLHNIQIDLDNNANNRLFTNGYGITMHSYFINRHYIESIIQKNGNLPTATGRHIDFEINVNKFDKNNMLYSEKIFFTKKTCMLQIVDANSKSDNYLNLFDNICRQDIINDGFILLTILGFIRNHIIINDDAIKIIGYIINRIVVI